MTFNDFCPCPNHEEPKPAMNDVRSELEPGRSDVRDGIRIDWDVPIRTDDGLILRANVYRPDDEGQYPVIMTHGPYGKDVAWQEAYPTTWDHFSSEHPDAIANSSNVHQSWETVDPEKWVPDGYVVIRVDSRGAGRSPGTIDCWSPRETKDYANAIEWAGTQPWSNGRVGLCGISYYAINQWQVAALQPDHLEAMCVWEGANDHYRDMLYHGGIYCRFIADWYDMQVMNVQHGYGDRGFRSPINGELAAGPETLDEDELRARRLDYRTAARQHPLDDAWHREKSVDFSKITVPLLSAASWGGQGLHPRGNYEGFLGAASQEKWLEGHGLEHWTEFYTPYGIGLQKQFFGHYLKGEETGWTKRPPVLLRVRQVDDSFIDRTETAWPLPNTDWTRLYLDAGAGTLGTVAPVDDKTITYQGMGDGVTFLLPSQDKPNEITGPLSAKLFVSSETSDADLFLVARLFTPDLKEITFKGTLDPHTPLAQGWLRASHRKLDPKHSEPWRPWHTHDEAQPLEKDEIYELDIEIWPTCINIPANYRLGLSVRGTDYVYPGASGQKLSNMKESFTGCGPFLHDDPEDRPADIFGGNVTLHTGPKYPSHLLVPFIPPR
jgi:predicted acyl esterase